MAVLADGLKVARLIRATLGLWLDVVNGVSLSETTCTHAGLAEVLVSAQYLKAQLGPLVAISTLVAVALVLLALGPSACLRLVLITVAIGITVQGIT